MAHGDERPASRVIGWQPHTPDLATGITETREAEPIQAYSTYGRVSSAAATVEPLVADARDRELIEPANARPFETFETPETTAGFARQPEDDRHASTPAFASTREAHVPLEGSSADVHDAMSRPPEYAPGVGTRDGRDSSDGPESVAGVGQTSTDPDDSVGRISWRGDSDTPEDRHSRASVSGESIAPEEPRVRRLIDAEARDERADTGQEFPVSRDADVGERAWTRPHEDVVADSGREPRAELAQSPPIDPGRSITSILSYLRMMHSLGVIEPQIARLVASGMSRDAAEDRAIASILKRQGIDAGQVDEVIARRRREGGRRG